MEHSVCIEETKATLLSVYSFHSLLSLSLSLCLLGLEQREIESRLMN